MSEDTAFWLVVGMVGAALLVAAVLTVMAWREIARHEARALRWKNADRARVTDGWFFAEGDGE